MTLLYGFVPAGGNPHDTAGLRWDIGLLEGAREVAGLSAVPFGRKRGAGNSAGAGAALFAPWQEKALRELRLEGPG